MPTEDGYMTDAEYDARLRREEARREEARLAKQSRAQFDRECERLYAAIARQCHA